MKKQTAVEWLVYVVQSNIAPNYIPKEIVEKAKEMESKQKGYSEDQVKKAITNFYMNDFLLTEEKLTKVINDLKQQEQ
jgi:hypothetical protein